MSGGLFSQPLLLAQGSSNAALVTFLIYMLVVSGISTLLGCIPPSKHSSGLVDCYSLVASFIKL